MKATEREVLKDALQPHDSKGSWGEGEGLYARTHYVDYVGVVEVHHARRKEARAA